MCLFVAFCVLPVRGRAPDLAGIRELAPDGFTADGFEVVGIEGWPLARAVGDREDRTAFCIVRRGCSCDLRGPWRGIDHALDAVEALVRGLHDGFGGLAVVAHWDRGPIATEEVGPVPTDRLGIDELVGRFRSTEGLAEGVRHLALSGA